MLSIICLFDSLYSGIVYYVFCIVATRIDSVGYESYDIHLIGLSGELTYILRQIVGIFFGVCS